MKTNGAKLRIYVSSDKKTHRIDTVSVFDERTGEYWPKERIVERGISWFLSLADMKETLNWNLNGDESKYKFRFGMSSKTHSEGMAFVFD